MKLEVATETHLSELMEWFPDQRSCLVWAGSEFRFPFTQHSFREDVRLELPSYVMVNSDNELMGFGQYYLRIGRCHLARLAISPSHRGQALGARLIHELSLRGRQQLCVNEYSLFVFPDNKPAISLYKRLGFMQTSYPEKGPQFDACVYMVAPQHAVIVWGSAQQGAQEGRAVEPRAS